MMNIAFFQSKGLSCIVLISNPNLWLEVEGDMEVHSLLSGAGSVIQTSLLLPAHTQKAFPAAL